MSTPQADQHLDVRGLLCPMPVIRAQGCIRKMLPGQTLEVLCTDPGALHDIPAWCRVNGHAVLDTGERGREVFVLVEVGEQESLL